MRYYPVLLDLKGKKCFVVGAGAVAERKTRTLISAGANVTVISPKLTKGLSALVRAKKIRSVRSEYRKDLVKSAFLIVAATDKRKINHRVFCDAQVSGSLINVVDVPEDSNFIVPSVIEKNGLIISISTSGKAPCLSRKIRQDLQKHFIPKYAALLKETARIRQELKQSCQGFFERRKRLYSILDKKI